MRSRTCRLTRRCISSSRPSSESCVSFFCLFRCSLLQQCFLLFHCCFVFLPFFVFFCFFLPFFAIFCFYFFCLFLPFFMPFTYIVPLLLQNKLFDCNHPISSFFSYYTVVQYLVRSFRPSPIFFSRVSCGWKRKKGKVRCLIRYIVRYIIRYQVHFSVYPPGALVDT